MFKPSTNGIPHKWLVLAAVAMGVFLATIDGSIVNIALPTLVNSLHVPFALVEWVVLAYLLTITTLMLSIGRLADMVGKKSLFLAGMIIFTTGSLLCGLSTTIGYLIASRVIQAVGAALTMALGTAIVTEAFPSEERGRALGLNGLMVSLGIIIGPTLGGLLLEHFSWNWLFFVNLPVGLAGIIMVIRYVPASIPGQSQRFDFPGGISLFASLMCFLLALTLGQHGGFAQPFVLALMAGFVIFMAAFILIELRTEQPLIDLTIFRSGLFSVNLITGFMAFICNAGTTLLMPFYLQEARGFSPQQAGLMLAVVPLTVGIIAPISGALSDKIGSRILTAFGLAVMTGGFFAVSTLAPDTSVAGYVLRFLPIGVGIGFFNSPNNSAVMGSVPRNRLGVASGLLSITRTLGQTTGIALLGALWASRTAYHSSAVLQGSATDAPVLAQVLGLQDSISVLVIVISAAFLLSLWAFLHDRRLRRLASQQVPLTGSDPFI